MRFISLLALLLLCCSLDIVYGQDISLSPEAEVSILTMSPIQSELYSAFGHSAVRVSDAQNRIDIFYNYGVFDFDQPNFYLNFARGKLLYKLGLGSSPRYIKHYTSENRTITEQFLNLNEDQKQKVFDFLTENAKPENADYYYNYCYNNCATKIRDVINLALDNEVKYNYAYANDSLSYRGLMDKYLAEQPWGDVAIDYCLGIQIDEIANGAAYMYMPEYLQAALDGAVVSTDSSDVPLVRKTKVLNVAADAPSAASLIQPFYVFVVIFFLVGIATHRGLKYNMNFRWIDVMLYGVTGILGFSLIFLWFGTDHLSEYNFNLIWSTPLNLLALIFLLKHEKPSWLRYYFNVYGFLMILQIILSSFLPQQLNQAFIPLILGLIVRSFYLGYQLRVNSDS